MLNTKHDEAHTRNIFKRNDVNCSIRSCQYWKSGKKKQLKRRSEVLGGRNQHRPEIVLSVDQSWEERRAESIISDVWQVKMVEVGDHHGTTSPPEMLLQSVNYLWVSRVGRPASLAGGVSKYDEILITERLSDQGWSSGGVSWYQPVTTFHHDSMAPYIIQSKHWPVSLGSLHCHCQ